VDNEGEVGAGWPNMFGKGGCLSLCGAQGLRSNHGTSPNRSEALTSESARRERTIPKVIRSARNSDQQLASLINHLTLYGRMVLEYRASFTQRHALRNSRHLITQSHSLHNLLHISNYHR
jgi:hypothetical protein